MEDKISCHVCNHTQGVVVKKCTHCQKVYYCSRECQMKDWPKHKKKCQILSRGDNSDGTPSARNQHGINTEIDKNYNSEMGNSHNNTVSASRILESSASGTESVNCLNLDDVDQTAISTIDATAIKSKNGDKSSKTPILDLQERHTKEPGKSYLCKDEHYFDLPTFSTLQPHCEVVVKYNKCKHKIKIQLAWTGEEIMKYFSSMLSLPLDKLGLIHKGRKISADNILDCTANKAVFQAFGEQAADDEGLDGRDIDALMKQLGLERNDAVEALHRTGDLVDAMLDIGNK